VHTARIAKKESLRGAVFRIRIRIRPDPDRCGRIRILTLINGPITTFLVCVKAVIAVGISDVNPLLSFFLFLRYTQLLEDS
jgi:hypothetical protein